MSISALRLNLQQNLWTGSIPTKFTIHAADITALLPPDPIYILIPRFSYISAVVEDIVNHFRSSVLDFENEVWFEYNTIPLKANLPFGVLFDLFFDSSPSELPWHIIVHYSAFPSDKIIRCASKVAARRHFAHSMKQALYLLHGSTRAFNEMNLDKQAQLWDAVCQANRGLFESIVKDSELRPPPEQARLMPVRVLYRSGQRIVQKNVPVYAPGASPSRFTTLQYLLDLAAAATTTAAEIVLSSSSSSSSNTETDKAMASTEKVNKVENDESNGEDEESDSGNVTERVMMKAEDVSSVFSTPAISIQGIEIPVHTPLYLLWTTLSHADLFLYVVIRK